MKSLFVKNLSSFLRDKKQIKCLNQWFNFHVTFLSTRSHFWVTQLFCPFSMYNLRWTQYVFLKKDIWFYQLNSKRESKKSVSGVLWQGSRLVSVENSNFALFQCFFYFSTWNSVLSWKIISMTVLNKAESYIFLCLLLRMRKINNFFNWNWQHEDKIY